MDLVPPSKSLAGLTSSALRSLEDVVHDAPKVKDAPYFQSPAPWQDELGRLRLWAGNTGAHQKDSKSSLEFRLRDASDIREYLRQLLYDIERECDDIHPVLYGLRMKGIARSSAEDEEVDVETELEQWHGTLARLIRCLFQMAMLIRRPAPHDFLTEPKLPAIPFYKSFDLGHVREKFPMAPLDLQSRLARANTWRRQYLKYRERHQAKLSRGMGKDGITVHDEDVSELSDTYATEFRPLGMECQDTESDDNITQTSYAFSSLDGGRLLIPLAPNESAGGAHFECPYCFMIINIRDTRSWIKHVYEDLRPYVCIAQECSSSDRMYVSRHEWISHMNSAHPGEGLESDRGSDRYICQLCLCEQGSRQLQLKHIVRHLQELALFVLPRDEKDSEAIKASSDENESDGMSDAGSDKFMPSSGEEEANTKSPRTTPFIPEKPSSIPIEIFRAMIKQMGTDWEAIAVELDNGWSPSELKAKYEQEIKMGDKLKLEMIARRADERGTLLPGIDNSDIPMTSELSCMIPGCKYVAETEHHLSRHMRKVHEPKRPPPPVPEMT